MHLTQALRVKAREDFEFMSTHDLLRVCNVSTRFLTETGQINAVEDISFTVRDGETFGIVGESGSGKSVTAHTIMGLIESPGRITSGEIWYRDSALADAVGVDESNGAFVNLVELDAETRRALRGPSFGMIFQDPMSSMDPSVTVGEQIAQAVEAQRRASTNPRSVSTRTQQYGLMRFVVDSLIPHRGYVSTESKQRAIELLDMAGIPDPTERAEAYPHEFSGGMLQRAMIAQALAGEPDVLVADEPTTALDVTIQAQILSLLSEIQAETDMSVILITHNLGVIARMCDRVGVMYAGEIVERGSLADIFEDAVHPYTKGLLGSVPDIDTPGARLEPVAGSVPSLVDEEMGERCYFADRCPKAMEACLDPPPEFDADTGTVLEDDTENRHGVKCVLAQRGYDPDASVSISNANSNSDGDIDSDDSKNTSADNTKDIFNPIKNVIKTISSETNANANADADADADADANPSSKTPSGEGEP